MKHEHGQLWFSATDLANHLGCTHLTGLNRKVADGLLKLEYRRDPMLELLIELCQMHEQEYLDALRAEGKSVVEIGGFDEQVNAERTVDAMRQGVDVIAQASLVSLPWRGRADVLLKVEQPSQLGNWSYEVVDVETLRTLDFMAFFQVADC